MANQWFRLWHDMPNDPKFKTVARLSGQPISIVLSVFLHLLNDASQNVTRGHIDVTAEDLASALDVEEDVILRVLSAMENRLVVDGALTGWEKRQPKLEDDINPETGTRRATERKRAQRERDKNNNKIETVTECHTMSHDVTTDKDKDKDKEYIKEKIYKKESSPEPDLDTEPKKTKPNRKARDPLPDPPEWIPKKAWADFVEHRQNSKHALTCKAAELAFNTLEKLKEAGNDLESVINQSILNGYRGLFEVKQNNKTGWNGYKTKESTFGYVSTPEELARAPNDLDAWIAEQRALGNFPEEIQEERSIN